MLLANIPQIEYSNIVQALLRSYKANIFQALSHPTRIAVLEVLREGPLSAGAIQERLGIEQANLSQHLAILRSRQIVTNRKDGNQVFYSLRNPMLLEVLDIMRRYFQANLTEAVQMLARSKRSRERDDQRKSKMPGYQQISVAATALSTSVETLVDFDRRGWIKPRRRTA